MKRKLLVLPFLLVVAVSPLARGESAEAWTSAIRLDLRPSPRAASIGEAETLVFGDHWAGLDGDAVRIRLDGAEFATGTGEGTVVWTPSGSGFFTFEHTTLSGGAAVGDPLTASFYVGSLVPQNLRASDGTSPDHVLVEWNAIAGTGYELFRATTNEFAYAVSIGTTNEPAWLDTTAKPGETYWYWVRSIAGTLVSEPSASDDGWRAPRDPVPVVAEGWSGPYDGTEHGISVTGSAPGFAVRYGTSPTGPFAADAPAWRDAGGPHEVWFVASAPYFVPVTNSATVTITPRPLTVTADPKTKVFGTADPALTCTAEGLVSGETLTGALSREAGEAVGAYAIGQGTLSASANYGLSFTGGTFTITKATLPGGGEEPGDGAVPEGGLSRFDTTAMFDGQGHTIDTNALVAAFEAAMGAGCEVAYAAGADGAAPPVPATWSGTAPAFTNVCAETVWYRVTNPNYEDFVHAARATVTNRPATVTVTGHSAAFA